MLLKTLSNRSLRTQRFDVVFDKLSRKTKHVVGEILPVFPSREFRDGLSLHFEHYDAEWDGFTYGPERFECRFRF